MIYEKMRYCSEKQQKEIGFLLKINTFEMDIIPPLKLTK